MVLPYFYFQFSANISGKRLALFLSNIGKIIPAMVDLFD
jgi:hypothetical protein